MTKPSFLDAIGHRIEKLIDSIPILGVPTPIQPWDPLQDTKAAILSDPFDVLKTLLKWDFHFGRLLQENTLFLNNLTGGKKSRGDLSMEEEMPLIGEPILVTSDDASVERSVASFADLNTDEESHEECPSVVTECDVEENAVKDMNDVQVNFMADAQVTEDDVMLTDDENDYVLADEPESEDEDFVDLGAEA
ncbi:hypothetical protein ACHAWO_008210 [Cyclotella atomus]|uniref:Uncharacterized protein n=1 Tax=Cyclotella atomus TaxID=382360 RepID=A0ABD3NYT0_9STRA